MSDGSLRIGSKIASISPALIKGTAHSTMFPSSNCISAKGELLFAGPSKDSPKSATLALCSSSMRMLEDFMSRWITGGQAYPCRYSIPRAAWTAIVTRFTQSSCSFSPRLLPWRCWCNEPFAMYSYTSSLSPPSSQYPRRLRRWAWFSLESKSSSVWNSFEFFFMSGRIFPFSFWKEPFLFLPVFLELIKRLAEQVQFLNLHRGTDNGLVHFSGASTRAGQANRAVSGLARRACIAKSIEPRGTRPGLADSRGNRNRKRRREASAPANRLQGRRDKDPTSEVIPGCNLVELNATRRGRALLDTIAPANNSPIEAPNPTRVEPPPYH
nr:hypothetical protein Iba_chr14aCG24380 [Ipomoea batatas]GMD85441.1 hypothetical protein Iba_chr14aCG24390 [Ipomoea batatas]